MDKEPNSERHIIAHQEVNTLSTSKIRPKIFQFDEPEALPEQDVDSSDILKNLQLKVRQLTVYSIKIRNNH